MIIPHPSIPIASTTETINSLYGNKSVCFVALHPFILTKPGHEHLITFDDYFNRPEKSEILEHCQPMSWVEFMSIAGLRDVGSLARCIIFMERGRRLVERAEYLKMCGVLDKRPEIMTPPVDWIPELWENDLGNYLLTRNQLYLELDLHGLEAEVIEAKSLLGTHCVLSGPFSRIKTPDGTLSLHQNSDEPYTLILGEKDFVVDLVNNIDLEGFFTNMNTPIAWSDMDIPDDGQMDWQEDTRRIRR
jgi:hypothetical protein